MVLPRWLARANRHVTNPLLRLIPRRWSPFTIVHHVGRRSARSYTTPLATFRTPTGFVLTPTYGPEADWVKNLLASQQFEIDRRGKMLVLWKPQLVGRDEVWPSLPFVVRAAMVLLHVRWFVVADEVR